MHFPVQVRRAFLELGVQPLDRRQHNTIGVDCGDALVRGVQSDRGMEVEDLRVEQCYDEHLRRHLRLLDPATPGHARMAPSLYDVQLIGMSPPALSLSGFERVLGVEYAQSWLLQDIQQAR